MFYVSVHVSVSCLRDVCNKKTEVKEEALNSALTGLVLVMYVLVQKVTSVVAV